MSKMLTREELLELANKTQLQHQKRIREINNIAFETDSDAQDLLERYQELSSFQQERLISKIYQANLARDFLLSLLKQESSATYELIQKFSHNQSRGIYQLLCQLETQMQLPKIHFVDNNQDNLYFMQRLKTLKQIYSKLDWN